MVMVSVKAASRACRPSADQWSFWNLVLETMCDVRSGTSCSWLTLDTSRAKRADAISTYLGHLRMGHTSTSRKQGFLKLIEYERWIIRWVHGSNIERIWEGDTIA